jgi:prolyl-tRNA synthetase
MRLSRQLVSTAKEASNDSARALLTRAGYLLRVGRDEAWLPLGARVLTRVEGLLDDAARGFETLEVRVVPGNAREPNASAVLLAAVAGALRSYRDLPKRFRARAVERRCPADAAAPGSPPRFAEVLVAFDADEAAWSATRLALWAGFESVLARTGLDVRGLEAAAASGAALALRRLWAAPSPWAPRDARAEELHLLSASGEEDLLVCDACEYAAHASVATTQPLPPVGPGAEDIAELERVATPDVLRIEDLARFFALPAKRFLKSLIYAVARELVMVVVRGDHAVNEAKLARVLGVPSVALASAAEVEQVTGAAVGFAGPVGFKGRILIDRDAARVRDAVTGANATDTHLRHVVPGRDFSGETCDVRLARPGDACPECGADLRAARGSAIARVESFADGSVTLGGSHIDASGSARPNRVTLGTLYPTELVLLVAACSRDPRGLCWPESLAPYDIELVPVGPEPEVMQVTLQLEAALEAAGLEVLTDDREVRPGPKFADADLLGVPWRVTLGARSLAHGAVEVKPRREADPKRVESVPLDVVVALLRDRIPVR